MNNNLIPLNNHFFNNEEKKVVLNALRSDDLTGDGLYSRQLSLELKKYLGVKYALPTPSGTAALELAIMSIDLQPKDEVILPSFTFSSCANAILREKGKPIFADIEERTFNIDPDKIESLITKKTKAIMLVHYAGHSVNFEPILKIAKKYNLIVIEDAAHSLGAFYKGKPLGTISDIGCFSFHGVKNVIAGEGGAIVTNNHKLGKKAEIIRDKGTNRSAFIRGEVDKYTWHSLGSSFVLADILSAIVIAQLKKIPYINKKRSQNANYLIKHLKKIDQITLPTVENYTTTNWHIFAIRVKERDKFIAYMRENNIEVSFHFIPLHSSPFGRKLGYKRYDLPVTEKIASELVRLPVHQMLKKQELKKIVATIENYFQ